MFCGRVYARRTDSIGCRVGSATTVNYGFDISNLVGIGCYCRVNDHRTVGNVGKIIVNQQPLVGKFLSQHILTRFANRNQLFLMIQIGHAGGLVNIVGDIHLSLVRHLSLCSILLGEEIAAFHGIRVEFPCEMGSCRVIGQSIAYRSVTIKNDFFIGTDYRHGNQVIIGFAI